MCRTIRNSLLPAAICRFCDAAGVNRLSAAYGEVATRREESATVAPLRRSSLWVATGRNGRSRPTPDASQALQSFPCNVAELAECIAVLGEAFAQLPIDREQ